MVIIAFLDYHVFTCNYTNIYNYSIIGLILLLLLTRTPHSFSLPTSYVVDNILHNTLP